MKDIKEKRQYKMEERTGRWKRRGKEMKEVRQRKKERNKRREGQKDRRKEGRKARLMNTKMQR